jgi:hypothetical protein
MRPDVSTGKLHLPNHLEMIRELRALESTRTSGGNYKISAPRGMHDDFVTVLALLAHRVNESAPREPWCEFLRVEPTRELDFGPERWWTKI